MAKINSKQTEKKKNIRSSIRKVIWALVLIVILAIAGVIGRDAGKYFTKKYLPSVGKGNSSISQLSRHTVGSTGLSILSPGVFKEKPLPIPENFQDKIVSFQNFEYCEGYKISISCSEVKYVPEIEASAEGAARNVLSSLSNLNGVSEFRHNQKPITQSGLNGINFRAEYKQNSAPIKAYGVVLTSESQMWQISIFCPATINESNNAAEKILNSINIERP